MTDITRKYPPHPELDAALAEAHRRVEAMTDAERAAMYEAQRASFVRGEMGWPKPKYRIENGVKIYASYEDYCHD